VHALFWAQSSSLFRGEALLFQHLDLALVRKILLRLHVLPLLGNGLQRPLLDTRNRKFLLPLQRCLLLPPRHSLRILQLLLQHLRALGLTPARSLARQRSINLSP